VLVSTRFTSNSAGHAYLASPAYIDPEIYFIVIVDALANGVSSSPSNSISQGNDRFPQITIADMVQSQHRLLSEVFVIDSVHAVVGLSMGGMQALEWAVAFPSFAD
jgi:homoserine O-acetyltransferase